MASLAESEWIETQQSLETRGEVWRGIFAKYEIVQYGSPEAIVGTESAREVAT
jgi:hypothetical protein